MGSTPIAGEKSTSASTRGDCSPSSRASAYCTDNAEPVEKPTRYTGASGPALPRTCRAAMRTAAAQSCQRIVLSADGAVPWPGSRSPTTQQPWSCRFAAIARSTYGESVSPWTMSAPHFGFSTGNS